MNLTEEQIEKLARVLCYYTEDGTMTKEALTNEFPPSYWLGEPKKEGTRDAFIDDTKIFLDILEELKT